LFKCFGLPVAADLTAGFQGPLGGLLTGLTWARRHHPGATHLLSVACDTPFLPRDLVSGLARSLSGAGIAIAADAKRSHPVIGLWPVTLAERLETDLAHGVRAVHRWLENFSVGEARFDAHGLQNINTAADLQAAEMGFSLSSTA
jgi:molybdopterin-guanine dinucleotide biosynthesis protein A